MSLRARATTEAIGTAFLLAAVVGSGIMGERLAGGNVAVALMANSTATGAVLVALILVCGDLSGAHFNPAVSFASAAAGEMPVRDASAYCVAQVIGAVVGVGIAGAMFGGAAFSMSTHVRSGAPQILSEVVATFGLLMVIFGCIRSRREAVPYAVAAYIAAAYWFTASTSFANPAVTLARAFTDTFAGIRLADVPAFVVAQAVAVGLAMPAIRFLKSVPSSRPERR